MVRIRSSRRLQSTGACRTVNPSRLSHTSPGFISKPSVVRREARRASSASAGVVLASFIHISRSASRANPPANGTVWRAPMVTAPFTKLRSIARSLLHGSMRLGDMSSIW